jgi:hypothetical protein
MYSPERHRNCVTASHSQEMAGTPVSTEMRRDMWLYIMGDITSADLLEITLARFNGDDEEDGHDH